MPGVRGQSGVPGLKVRSLKAEMENLLPPRLLHDFVVLVVYNTSTRGESHSVRKEHEKMRMCLVSKI